MKKTSAITINPAASDDHWVSPSGSDCWCKVGELKALILEHDNMVAALETLLCEEHRQAPDLHDQHQDVGGDCLLCTVQKLEKAVYSIPTVQGENATCITGRDGKLELEFPDGSGTGIRDAVPVRDAVLAERERCAAIVLKLVLAGRVADFVASMIRSGVPTEEVRP